MRFRNAEPASQIIENLNKLSLATTEQINGDHTFISKGVDRKMTCVQKNVGSEPRWSGRFKEMKMGLENGQAESNGLIFQCFEPYLAIQTDISVHIDQIDDQMLPPDMIHMFRPHRNCPLAQAQLWKYISNSWIAKYQ